MRKLAEMVAAKRAEKELAAHEAWTREELVGYQHRRIEGILRHAAEHSPFYRERIGAGASDLASVPWLDKRTFVERFDDMVCDRTLRRDQLLAHVDGLEGDALYRDRYRVIATSGSSGLKALFVYDRPDWARVMGGFLRFTSMVGVTPSIPRRRLAYVGAAGGAHMSRRMSATLDIGLHRIRNLPATLPVARLVDELDDHRPDILAGFPSILAVLAEEQLAGRLRITPSVVTTSSELRTPEMTAVIERAWGVRPFDNYGITESGVLGSECEEHRGIHVFEDLVAVEVVDADGRPVPDGEVGEQMLLTSLDNHTLPVIRLAVSDRVAFDTEPCPCGRPMRLLRAVEGRSDDVIHLPSGNGRSIPVHPLQFAPVAQAREVKEFQVVQEGPALNLRVVLHPGADAGALERRLAEELQAKLRGLGVADPVIRLQPCERLERDAAKMGKLKLVVAEAPPG